MTASLKLDSRMKKRERYSTLKTRSPYLFAENAEWSAVSTISGTGSKSNARWNLRSQQKSSTQSPSELTASPERLDMPAARSRSQTVTCAEGYRYRSRMRDNVTGISFSRADDYKRPGAQSKALEDVPEGVLARPLVGTRFLVQPAHFDSSSPFTLLQTVMERPRRASLAYGEERSLTAADTGSESGSIDGLLSSGPVPFHPAALSVKLPADSQLVSIAKPASLSPPAASSATVSATVSTTTPVPASAPSPAPSKTKSNKTRWRSLVDAMRRRRGNTQPESDKAERRAEKKEKRKRSTSKTVPPPKSHLTALTLQNSLGVPVTVTDTDHVANAETWTKGARVRGRDPRRLLDKVTDGDTQSHSDFEALALEHADDDRASTAAVSLHEDTLHALDVEGSSNVPPLPRKASISAVATAASIGTGNVRRHRQSDSEVDHVPHGLALRLIDDVACVDEAAQMHKPHILDVRHRTLHFPLLTPSSD